MCSVVWATMLIVQTTNPARTSPRVVEDLSLLTESLEVQARPKTYMDNMLAVMKSTNDVALSES